MPGRTTPEVRGRSGRIWVSSCAMSDSPLDRAVWPSQRAAQARYSQGVSRITARRRSRRRGGPICRVGCDLVDEADTEIGIGRRQGFGRAYPEVQVFERFTDRARRVVVLAQEEARMLRHNYIGTEHILLGLVRERDGVAARALDSLNIRLEAVRQQVEEIIGQGQAAPTGHIPFTPRAKKVLELSLREALQLGHNYIGTEHILLGLIREGEGVAAQVLQQLGADLNRVRQTVVQLLSGYRAGAEVTGVEGAAEMVELTSEMAITE